MEKLPWIIDRKRQLVKAYAHRISEIPGIILPSEPEWGGHIYQSYVILVDKKLDRDRIVQEMKSLGVETTIGTYALHTQPFFQRQFGYQSGQLEQSHTAYKQTITLPLYHQMTEADLDRVGTALKSVVLKLID